MTFANYFQGLSITGNASIDMMLLTMLIIPYMNTIINFITMIVTSVCKSIYSSIFSYIKYHLKRKYIGDKIAIYIINKEDALFDKIMTTFIKSNNIPEANLPSAGRIMSLIKSSLKNDKGNKTYIAKNWFNKYNITQRIQSTNIDDINTVSNMAHMVNSQLVVKYYKYEGCGIKMKTSLDEKNNQIKVEIIKYNNKVIVPPLDIFKKFMKQYMSYNKKYIYYIGWGSYGSVLGDKIYRNIGSKKIFKDYIYKQHKKIDDNNVKFNNKCSLNIYNLVYNDIESKYINKNYIDIGVIHEELAENILPSYFSSNESQHVETNRTVGEIIGNDMAIISYATKDKNYYYKSKIISNIKLIEEDILNISKIILDIYIPSKSNSPTPDKISLYKYVNNKWDATQIKDRSLDTIYLPEVTKKRLINEIDMFINQNKLYTECEIPYKKGILLYGPPGTGKTSTVKALACKYGLNIYVININDKNINDDSLSTILNSMQGDIKILLFEDIDSAFSDKEELISTTRNRIINMTEISNQNDINTNNDDSSKKKDTKTNIICDENPKFLTYSGLLNALDGVMSNQTGVITIMTTNYIEKLGSAFSRPGRIDVKIELNECDAEQIMMMLNSFISRRNKVYIEANNRRITENESNLDSYDIYKINDELTDKIKCFIKKITNDVGKSTIIPAKMQVYIMKYINDLDGLFENYRELYE